MNDSKIEMKLEEEMKPLKKMCEKITEAVEHELSKGVENVDAKELGEVIDVLKDIYEAKEKIAKTCYYTKILKAMEEEEEEEKKQDEYMMQRFKEEYSDNPDEAKRGYDNWRLANGEFAPKGRGHRTRGYNMMPWDMSPDMDMYGVSDSDRRNIDRKMGRNVHYYGGESGNSGMNGGNSGGNMGGNSNRGYDDGFSDGHQKGYSDGYEKGRNESRQNESRYERSKRGYSDAKMKNTTHSKEENEREAQKAGEMFDEVTQEIDKLIENAPAETKTVLKHKASMWASRM